MPDEDDHGADAARAADENCHRHALYLLGDFASENEFLSTAMFAVSAHVRAYGRLKKGFHLSASQLDDRWNCAPEGERERLRLAIRALAERAIAELPEAEEESPPDDA